MYIQLMNILSASQTKAADAYTIEHEPIASIDLMERASIAFVEAFSARINTNNPVTIICGTGNNGGDGLAVARLLTDRGYETSIKIVQPNESGTPDFIININKLDSSLIHWIRSAADIPEISSNAVIIDALFGSGLTRPVEGVYAKVIDQVNKSDCIIVSIDVPSGLFMDQPTTGNTVVRASHTISFQLPKLAFFFPENAVFVGEWSVVDIGLDQEFIAEQTSNYSSAEPGDIKGLMAPRSKFSHKGSFGHGQLIAGSYGKMGAAILASSAFLRSGAGLLTVTSAKCGVDILQTSIPEAMVIDQEGDFLIQDFKVHDNVTVVGIGPGIGQDKATLRGFKVFLQKNKHNLVLDADAINLLSSNRELLENLPEGTILTPHIKEFDRLAGPSEDNWQRLVKAQNICSERGLIIVLKGAHTAVINANGKISFNTTGNPGMATAGSGDVLLGIITGLRAQGLDAFNSARLGVYLHGLAGDIASKEHSEEALLASDIINSIGKAFLSLRSEPFR